MPLTGFDPTLIKTASDRLIDHFLGVKICEMYKFSGNPATVPLTFDQQEAKLVRNNAVRASRTQKMDGDSFASGTLPFSFQHLLSWFL